MEYLKFILTSALFLLNIFTPSALSAEGITILQLNGRTELLLDGEETAEHTYIELSLKGEAEIELTDGTGSRIFNFFAGPNPEKIFLYKSLTELTPSKIIIRDSGKGFDLTSARKTVISSGQAPLPADIGHIIFSDFRPADGRDWIVYSWNIIPEVLIFDTSDYNVQARLFKRLAFFVEKPGYTGRLVPNTELEGKHGWNAHDYKPEDLADFFNKAENTGFRLNNEELELRDILLDHGILRKTGEGDFSPGTGAVLSVSRETEKSWRYRFLTHECLHGIFFTDSQYKAEIYKVFGELTDEETEFWKHLLDYRRYDINNTYLLINEFMAYSLQQPKEEVNEYFKGFLFRKMTEARPYESKFVEEFDKNFPDSFINGVSKLEEILYNRTGRIAGHLANLFPVEIKDGFFDLFPPI